MAAARRQLAWSRGSRRRTGAACAGWRWRGAGTRRCASTSCAASLCGRSSGAEPTASTQALDADIRGGGVPRPPGLAGLPASAGGAAPPGPRRSMRGSVVSRGQLGRWAGTSGSAGRRDRGGLRLRRCGQRQDDAARNLRLIGHGGTSRPDCGRRALQPGRRPGRLRAPAQARGDALRRAGERRQPGGWPDRSR